MEVGTLDDAPFAIAPTTTASTIRRAAATAARMAWPAGSTLKSGTMLRGKGQQTVP